MYLGEGLEENGEAAYFDCKSLTEIKIPPSTITMEVKAFVMRQQLTRLILGEGLKEIGEGAFKCCKLREIVIPPSVKDNKEGLFRDSLRLSSVILGEGLEDIREGAFERCTSLQGIVILIPPSAKAIREEHSDVVIN